MFKEREAMAKAFVVFADAIVVAAAYFAAILLRNELRVTLPFPGLLSLPSLESHASITIRENLYLLVVAIPIWLYMLNLNHMYKSLRTMSYLKMFWKVIRAGIMTILCLSAILFIFKISSASRLFLSLFLGMSLLLIMLEKTVQFALMHYIRRRGHNHHRLLIVGTGPRAARFIARIRKHPEWGLQVIGAIDDEPGRGLLTVDGVDIIGNIQDIQDILHRCAVDEVTFVVPRSRLSSVEQALHECETEGVVTTFTVDLFDMKIARPTVSDLDGLPLLQFQTTHISEWQLAAKRTMDIVISGSVLIILMPLFLVLIVAIRASSRGSAFFKQERVGLHGRRFILFKFRTMLLGAHSDLSQVNDVAEMDTPEFRAAKIKWMTPIGRLMRKFSLDELPQLMNVFRGNMSLIGPRPTVPDEVDKYKPWQRRRFSMKPGITCLWQVSGRNKIGFEDWMKLDLKYVDNWSLGLDIMIMLRTVPVVIFGIGAY